jgi:hypothetical protein
VNGCTEIGAAVSILIFTPSSSLLSWEGEIVVEFVRARDGGGLLIAGADLAIGKESPRSFPRLATPTPHVN